MPLAHSEYLVKLAFLFTLGGVLGSLLNVCIYRLPRHEAFWPALRGLMYPPSRCPGCFRPIPFYDNVPIFGWIKLGGRCRFCKFRIPIRYPLIELFTAVLFVVVYCCEVPIDWHDGIQNSGVYHAFGPQGAPWAAWSSPMAMLHWRYAFHMLLILALIVATFIDFDLRIIPDTVTLPAMAVGVLGNGLLGNVYLVPLWYRTPDVLSYGELYRLFFEKTLPRAGLPEWLRSGLTFSGVPDWVRDHPHLHGLAVSLAGLLVGGGIVWVVRAVGFRVLKREAMGFGDVVLMAMIGSFIGWQPVLVVFFVAPLCALGVACGVWLIRRDREIPYGPYLSLATLVVILGWKWIWPLAERQVFALGPLLPVAAIVMVVSLAGLLWLSRRVQQLLGIYPDDDGTSGEWTPGDQLAFLAGTSPHDASGQWRTGQWPGTLAGRGLFHQHRWRGLDSVPPGRPWQHNGPRANRG